MKKNEKEINSPEYLTAGEYAALPPNEREGWVALDPRAERVPLAAKVIWGVLGACVLIYVVAIFSEPFANFFTKYIGHVFRMLLAKLTGILPFSLAELLIISLIPLAVLYILQKAALHLEKHTCRSCPAAIGACGSALSICGLPRHVLPHDHVG